MDPKITPPPREVKEVIKYAVKYIRGKTIDLGAGSAKYRNIIKPHTTEYITFDLVPGENIDIVGNVLDLPFKDNTFDTIISTGTLEHVEKPWIMVKEIQRVLKPGGICVAAAPFLSAYHPDPKDCFRYTTDGFKSLFENFEILECSRVGGPAEILYDFIRFSLFDPYKRKQKRKIVRRIIRRMVSFMRTIAHFLDKYTSNKKFYCNVYVVAKKKL